MSFANLGTSLGGAPEVSSKNVAAKIAAGLVVELSGDSESVVALATGVPHGITGGMKGDLCVAIVEKADKTRVQLDAAAAPTLGAQVYAVPGGKVTQDSSATGAVAMNAKFMSVKLTDGRESNLDVWADNIPYALISSNLL